MSVYWSGEVIVRNYKRQVSLGRAITYMSTDKGNAVAWESKFIKKGCSASAVPSSTSQKRIVMAADTRNHSAEVWQKGAGARAAGAKFS